jgi:hypothetical protein
MMSRIGCISTERHKQGWFPSEPRQLRSETIVNMTNMPATMLVVINYP